MRPAWRADERPGWDGFTPRQGLCVVTPDGAHVRRAQLLPRHRGVGGVVNWSHQEESNPRHPAYKAGVLPTELWWQARHDLSRGAGVCAYRPHGARPLADSPRGSTSLRWWSCGLLMHHMRFSIPLTGWPGCKAGTQHLWWWHIGGMPPWEQCRFQRKGHSPISASLSWQSDYGTARIIVKPV